MQTLLEPLENRTFFAATGLPDTSFGVGGVASISFRATSANDLAIPVKVLVDKIGRTYVVAHTSDTLQVRRLTSSGLYDPTLANNRGLIGLPVSGKLFEGKSPGSVDAALDPADRLYLLVGTNIYRFSTTGTLDQSFGTNGVANLAGFSGARDIDIDSHNRILVAGSITIGTATDGTALQQFRIGRLRSIGLYDRAFNARGYYNIPLPRYHPQSFYDAYSKGEFIRALPDDSVVAAASASLRVNEPGVRLDPKFTGAQSVRFTASGILDTAYGIGGVALDLVGGTDVTFISQAPAGIRENGSVVVYYRYSSYDSDARGVHYELIASSGSIDHSYYIENDYVSSKVSSFSSAPGGGELIVDDLGRLLIRTKSDGTIDTTFKSNGKAAPIKGVSQIAFASSNSIVTLGPSSKRLVLNLRRLFV